jgi:hypothetical protein
VRLDGVVDLARDRAVALVAGGDEGGGERTDNGELGTEERSADGPFPIVKASATRPSGPINLPTMKSASVLSGASAALPCLVASSSPVEAEA